MDTRNSKRAISLSRHKMGRCLYTTRSELEMTKRAQTHSSTGDAAATHRKNELTHAYMTMVDTDGCCAPIGMMLCYVLIATCLAYVPMRAMAHLGCSIGEGGIGTVVVPVGRGACWACFAPEGAEGGTSVSPHFLAAGTFPAAPPRVPSARPTLTLTPQRSGTQL